MDTPNTADEPTASDVRPAIDADELVKQRRDPASEDAKLDIGLEPAGGDNGKIAL